MANRFEVERPYDAQSRPDRIGAKIAAVATPQHGVITHCELVALGLSRTQIRRLIARGFLIPLYRGVYAVGHRPRTPRSRRLAAVRAYGDDARLSDPSAARHWALIKFEPSTIHITIPGRRRARPGIRLHTRELPGDEVTVDDGIPVTTVPRTIFDLAAIWSDDRVEKLMAEAEFLELYDPLSLRDILARHPHTPGAPRIRRILDDLAEMMGVTREELEARFRRLLRRYGFSLPAFNAPIDVEGVWYRLDCWWPRERMAVELDGWGAHGRRRNFDSDRARDLALAGLGIQTVRNTWRNLRDHPDRIARQLKGLLASRSR